MRRSNFLGRRLRRLVPGPHRVRRIVQLYLGLVLFGMSMALLVRAGFGVMPWDVLHQGLARQLGVSLGTMTIAVGVAVLLAWLPLRVRPGLGTVSNVVVVGLAVDAALAVLPVIGTAVGTAPRLGLAALGVLLNGVATAAYVGVGLGPGPRDGLMTGLVRRTGRSVRLVRTTIEVVVVAGGWLLGGTLGIATVLYALAIGPLVHVLLPRLSVGDPSVPVARSTDAAGARDRVRAGVGLPRRRARRLLAYLAASAPRRAGPEALAERRRRRPGP